MPSKYLCNSLNSKNVIDSINKILVVYHLKARNILQGLFIDTFYDPSDGHERNKFSENVEKLWDFTMEVDPFECKDIKTALTELMEAQVISIKCIYILQHSVFQI